MQSPLQVGARAAGGAHSANGPGTDTLRYYVEQLGYGALPWVPLLGAAVAQSLGHQTIVIDGIAPVLSSPSPIDVNENASNNLELYDFNDLSGGDTDKSGDSLTYSIQSGNSDNIFGIGTNDGKLIVQDNSLLDHGNSERYTLTIQASDDCNTATTFFELVFYSIQR